MSDVEIEEDPDLQAYLPAAFGKPGRVANFERQIEESRRKPLQEDAQSPSEKHISKSEPNNKADSDDSEGSDESESEDEDEIPVTHELLVPTHTPGRVVTSAALDSAGSRMITGGADCTLKFHDFASMTPSTVRAFKTVDPSATKQSANAESHPIYATRFSPVDPSKILTILSHPQAKLLSREGDIIASTVKGDMYLKDMHNTKGHISDITAGAWHPQNRNLFATSSTDGTVRIWDVNNMRQQKHIIVIKTKSASQAGRPKITAVAWGRSPDGNSSSVLAFAADNGTITIYPGEGPFNRPLAEVQDAHKPGTWTTSLDISQDGKLLVSRGGEDDEKIKVWDIRKPSMPMIAACDHPSSSSSHPTSSVAFAPNGLSILAGTPSGELRILSAATLRPELETTICPEVALIFVAWHERLNQIIACSADGITRVLYSPKVSAKTGAYGVMLRAPKVRHADDDPAFTTDMSQGISGELLSGGNSGQIRAANSYAARHPNTGMTVSGRSRDPRRPHIPQQTPFAKGNPSEDHVRDTIKLSSMRDEDPREALLKYADKATSDPLFTRAWSKTQPDNIFRELSDDEDDISEEPHRKKVKQ